MSGFWPILFFMFVGYGIGFASALWFRDKPVRPADESEHGVG